MVGQSSFSSGDMGLAAVTCPDGALPFSFSLFNLRYLEELLTKPELLLPFGSEFCSIIFHNTL